LRQAWWIEDRDILTLVPHWNWAGREGAPIKVMAIGNCDSVELFLNGESLGEKPLDKFEMVSWDVPYAPGKIEASGRKGGKVVSRFSVETTGEPFALRLTPDRLTLAGDGWDAMPVAVEAVDATGRHVPTANLSVEFEVGGSGTNIGHGNGDPNSHEPEKGNRRHLFNGYAQIVIQSRREGSGEITLFAKSPGLVDARVRIPVRTVALVPAVPKVQALLNLRNWRVSLVTPAKPDPNQEIADHDQNSWQPVQPGQLLVLDEGRFMIFRTVLTPFAESRKKGGKITFESLVGHAEIWLDNQLAGVKESSGPGTFTVELPPAAGERILSVLVQGGKEKTAGLGGAVRVG
jgi:beta-galactosidase